MNIRCDDDGTAFVEVTERKESVKAEIPENDKVGLAPDSYSRDELRRLWLSFCTDSDATEKLAGFAECSIPAAKELIRRFQGESSCARRATEADAQRKVVNDTTTPKKPTGSPETPQKRKSKKVLEVEEDAEEIPVPGEFVPDAVIAAAVAQKHGLSVVEAEGRNKHGSKVVLVEKVSVNGIPFHRVKVAQYSYFRSFNSALLTARREKVKLLLSEHNNSHKN